MKLFLALIAALIAATASAGNLRQRNLHVDGPHAININRVYSVIGGYVRFKGKCKHIEDLTVTDGILREHLMAQYNQGQQSLSIDFTVRWQGIKATGDETGDGYILHSKQTNSDDYTLVFDDEMNIAIPASWSYSYDGRFIRQGDGVIFEARIEHELEFEYDPDTETLSIVSEQLTYNVEC